MQHPQTIRDIYDTEAGYISVFGDKRGIITKLAGITGHTGVPFEQFIFLHFKKSRYGYFLELETPFKILKNTTIQINNILFRPDHRSLRKGKNSLYLLICTDYDFTQIADADNVGILINTEFYRQEIPGLAQQAAKVMLLL